MQQNILCIYIHKVVYNIAHSGNIIVQFSLRLQAEIIQFACCCMHTLCVINGDEVHKNGAMYNNTTTPLCYTVYTRLCILPTTRYTFYVYITFCVHSSVLLLYSKIFAIYVYENW